MKNRKLRRDLHTIKLLQILFKTYSNHKLASTGINNNTIYPLLIISYGLKTQGKDFTEFNTPRSTNFGTRL